jgi:quercetin 2,3-dioxygenase
MPAVMPTDVLVLPRVASPDPTVAVVRPTQRIVTARTSLEGEGFQVRRPFPGLLSLHDVDPFLLLDHMGEVEYAPGEAKGTPWHPHRGFETVTYIMDGAFQHRDSTGGGGLISDGDTQWMTAGSGLLHIEQPPEWLVSKGGVFHGVQLWVNLPAEMKMTPPRYQDISSSQVKLLTTADGGSVIRLIAGSIGDHEGPGVTWTPITYGHVTIEPDAEVRLPWRSDFSAMVYVLSGSGSTGDDRTALTEGQLAVMGAGDTLVVKADRVQSQRSPKLEVLVLGGQPINEPIAHCGPFVMNTHVELAKAVDDFQSGRMGQPLD